MADKKVKGAGNRFLPGSNIAKHREWRGLKDTWYDYTEWVKVLGVMGGVIGTLQATEALKYILGIGDLLTGYLLTYDALTMTFRKIKIPRNPNCGICSDHPTITELIDYEQPACDLRHH